MNELRLKLMVVLVSLLAMTLPAVAQIHVIDYLGYGWESGAGDEFRFLGVADYVDPIFGVDLGTEELTFFVDDLVIVGSFDLGGGVTMVSYSGGFMDIYQDADQDADWGTNPPNATAPSTFSDGDLFFSGEFVDLTIFYNPDGSGSFSGNLDGTGGTMLDGGCTSCVYSWGGIFTTGAQLIEGYTMQIDGYLEVDEAVSTDTETWGSVKALFN